MRITGGTAVAAGNIIEAAQAEGELNTFLSALRAAGLLEMLQNEGPFTVFAPRDTAFGRLPAEHLDTLRGDRRQLEAFLKYHIVEGHLTVIDIMEKRSLTALNGERLNVRRGGGFTINDVPLVKGDIECLNGVLHIVDGVLTPPRVVQVL